MKISKNEYLSMVDTYWRAVMGLPIELNKVMPSYRNFLCISDENLSAFSDHFTLTPTGTQRWHMIKSPHIETLLRAWAIQHLPANDQANRGGVPDRPGKAP